MHMCTLVMVHMFTRSNLSCPQGLKSQTTKWTFFYLQTSGQTPIIIIHKIKGHGNTRTFEWTFFNPAHMHLCCWVVASICNNFFFQSIQRTPCHFWILSHLFNHWNSRLYQGRNQSKNNFLCIKFFLHNLLFHILSTCFNSFFIATMVACAIKTRWL